MATRCVSALVGVLLAAPCLWAGQNVVVVLDDSGSMGMRMRSDPATQKMDAAKHALIEVLERLPADTQVGVVALNQGAGDRAWIVPLGRIDQASMRSAVEGIRHAGGTPLGRFMKIGADALLALRERERYGTYRLLIVTDGEASDPDLVERYLPDILSRGITVDVIGVDMESDHSLATKVHSYRRADDPESLTRAISEVFAESVEDGRDTGESDFEMVAGIPSELAAAALAALAQSGNHPIGEAPPAPQSRARPPVDATTTPVGATTTTQATGLGVLALFLGFVCFMMLVVLVAVIGVVVLLRRSN